MQVRSRSTRWAVVGVWVVVLLIVFAGALLVAGCGSSSSGGSSQSPSAQSNIFRAAYNFDVSTWDPSASYGTEVSYMANIYEPLMYANPPGSAEPFSPALATSWEVSSDGLVWTFHLRTGVKFHDGTAFNAAAVKYSIDRTKKLNLGAAYLWTSLKEIKVVDDATVKFVLSDSVALDRITSSSCGSWMFSPATEGKSQEWWDEGHEAGTGPYILDSYKPNEELIFSQNADWWGSWKDDQFKKVVVKEVAEAGTQRQLLESGAVDGITLVDRDQVDALKGNPDVTVYAAPSLNTHLMFFNTQKKPLDNQMVRQALSYAIPYQDIITVGANGFGKQSRGPVPVGLWPNAAGKVPQYTHDIAKAKQMLADAGYPNGGFELNLIYSSEGSAAAFVPLIKQGFAEVGVTVKVQPMLNNPLHDKARGTPKDRQDLSLNRWWPSLPDGWDNLSPLFRSEKTVGANWAYWYNAEYDKTLNEAYKSSATDPVQSQQLYDKAQTMLVDQAPAAYLFDAEVVVAHLKTVAYDDMAINFNYPEVLFWSHVTH